MGGAEETEGGCRRVKEHVGLERQQASVDAKSSGSEYGILRLAICSMKEDTETTAVSRKSIMIFLLDVTETPSRVVDSGTSHSSDRVRAARSMMCSLDGRKVTERVFRESIVRCVMYNCFPFGESCRQRE
jgi:hypothetical protein